MNVTVNGEHRDVGDNSTLIDLAPDGQCEGIAMARNGEVVPRREWQDTIVRAGDEIEIVRAVQGG